MNDNSSDTTISNDQVAAPPEDPDLLFVSYSRGKHRLYLFHRCRCDEQLGGASDLESRVPVHRLAGHHMFSSDDLDQRVCQMLVHTAILADLRCLHTIGKGAFSR